MCACVCAHVCVCVCVCMHACVYMVIFGLCMLAPSFSCLNFCTVAAAPCVLACFNADITSQRSDVSRTRTYKLTHIHVDTVPHSCTLEGLCGEKENRTQAYKIKWLGCQGENGIRGWVGCKLEVPAHVVISRNDHIFHVLGLLWNLYIEN